jgi:lysine 2,3-aminomutase
MSPARTLRRPAELVAAGLAEPGSLAALERVAARYAVSLSPAMAELIDPSDPEDPIARQFIPDAAELHHLPEERADPIGDAVHEVVPGVVHRYPDRVLLKLVAVCPVYCRFCFPPRKRRARQADHAFRRCAGRGCRLHLGASGDLGNCPDRRRSAGVKSARVAAVTARLGAIEHVKILRWHSRVPVVAPGAHRPGDSRGAERRPARPAYVVIHANHPRELAPAACQAFARLADAGIPLLSQSVLLKGVNDDRPPWRR